MKKILIMFGEPITYGGQESVVINMLSSFNLNEKYNIDFFTPYFVDNKFIINYAKNRGKIYNYNFPFKIKKNPLYRLLSFKTIDNFLKNNIYDIIHIHSGSLITMYLYAHFAKKYNNKFIIAHAHNVSKNNLIYNIYLFIFNKLLSKNINICIGCSNSVLNTKFKFIDDNKKCLVYNGININEFKFNFNIRNEIRNKYNINKDFIIGSVGRLSYEKNNKFMLDILNELIKTNTNIKLMIVGDGEMLNELKNYSDNLNLNSHIIFTGQVDDTYKYYQAFDCFILPSLYEGLPMATIEAQTAKLPVFVSNNVTKEISISNKIKFLDINNLNIWVNNIKNIIDKKEKRDNTIVDYKKFDKNYSFDKIKTMYIKN